MLMDRVEGNQGRGDIDLRVRFRVPSHLGFSTPKRETPRILKSTRNPSNLEITKQEIFLTSDSQTPLALLARSRFLPVAWPQSSTRLQNPSTSTPRPRKAYTLPSSPPPPCTREPGESNRLSALAQPMGVKSRLTSRRRRALTLPFPSLQGSIPLLEARGGDASRQEVPFYAALYSARAAMGPHSPGAKKLLAQSCFRLCRFEPIWAHLGAFSTIRWCDLRAHCCCQSMQIGPDEPSAPPAGEEAADGDQEPRGREHCRAECSEEVC